MGTVQELKIAASIGEPVSLDETEGAASGHQCCILTNAAEKVGLAMLCTVLVGLAKRALANVD